MHTFEVKMKLYGDTVSDGVEKAVFIDGKKLDFSLDVTKLLEAKKKGMNYFLQEMQETEKRFVRVVSEAVGRNVTIEEIKQATITGVIQ